MEALTFSMTMQKIIEFAEEIDGDAPRQYGHHNRQALRHHLAKAQALLTQLDQEAQT